MQEKDYIKQLINRYLDNLYGADEMDKLYKTITSEVDSEYLEERMKELWEEYLSTAYKQGNDKEKLKKEGFQLLQKLQKKHTVRRIIPKWAGIAASLLIVLAASWGIYYMSDQAETNTEVVYQELHVPYGEKKEIILADGSRVILNAGTLIRYPGKFTAAERTIYLNGEAFFSVKANPKQPFIVQTEKITVKVLGTEFNIKAYGEDEQAGVSVRSGKVQVETEDITSRLSGGDHILLNHRTKDYHKKKVELTNITYWIRGGLVFNETPIVDVVKELTRIYDCKIQLEEGRDFDNLIMGEHDNKSIESVLKSLEYTSGIKFRKEGEYYILYKE